MNFKEKLGSLWNTIRGNRDGKPGEQDELRVAAKRETPHRRTDTEISAEEVVKEEIFPKGKTKRVCDPQNSACRGKTKTEANCAGKTPCGKKPPSKRTRPTNSSYEMIDPDGDTCDPSKS